MTETLAMLPGRIRKELIVMEYERALLYEQGQFSRLLEPGRYVFWRWMKVSYDRVSLRQMSEVISGQEVLSSDKIGVRVSLIAHYAVTDPVVAITTVENYAEQLYQELQLELRNAIASRTVEELLAARDEISDELMGAVAPLAAAYGLELRRVGVRDIVLPGNVRNVFMLEVEADRKGRAELIKARHEVAAARARANTAKILTENPAVIRLQELDALVDLAGKNGNVIMLPNLAELLTSRGNKANGNGNDS